MLNYRSIASQLCAAFPYQCLRFSFGTSIGFHTILVTELYKPDAEISTTLDQLSWFASLSFLSPISSITNGFLTQRLGSRILTFISASFFITSWLLYYYSTNTTIMFISRVLISLPATNTLSGPYVSEISEPYLRGPLLTINHLANVIGSFFAMLLGSFMYWRTIALVNLIFPILTLIFLIMIPNSPTWLASQGRYDEAEKALCWLRGWVQPAEVQTEFRNLVESVQQSKSTGNDKELDVEAVDEKTSKRQFFRSFLQRSFLFPFFTMCLMFIIQEFSGVDSIRAYAGVIFQKMNSPIDASTATAIMGGARFIGALTVLFSIQRLGKRKLVLSSMTIVSLCCFTIGLVGFLKLEGDYLWISPIALIVTTVAYESGVGTIFPMLATEIFPSSLRYIGTSICISVNTTTASIVTKLFLYIVEQITLSGIFILFFSVNIVGFVTFFCLFPETEGRSLKEIEDHYKGVKNLKDGKK